VCAAAAATAVPPLFAIIHPQHSVRQYIIRLISDKPVLISQTMLPSSYSEKCYHLHPEEHTREVCACMKHPQGMEYVTHEEEHARGYMVPEIQKV
jgi:hypothetical protein